MRNVPNHNITLVLESWEVSTHNSTNQDCPPLLQVFPNRLIWEKVNQLQFLQRLPGAFGVQREILDAVYYTILLGPMD